MYFFKFTTPSLVVAQKPFGGLRERRLAEDICAALQLTRTFDLEFVTLAEYGCALGGVLFSSAHWLSADPNGIDCFTPTTPSIRSSSHL